MAARTYAALVGKESKEAATSSDSVGHQNMATHTYAALVENVGLNSHETATSFGLLHDQNVLHGRLLCVKYIVMLQIQYLPESADDLKECFHAISRSAHQYTRNSFPLTQATCLEITNLLVEAMWLEDGFSVPSNTELCLDNGDSSVSEMYDHLCDWPTNATIRGRLATHLAYERLLHQKINGVTPTTVDDNCLIFYELAETDPDTCYVALTSLNQLLAKTTKASSPSIVNMYRTLAETANDRSVKFAAQEGLLCLVSGSNARPMLPEGVQLSTASYFEATNSSPSIVEGSLKLQGSFFDSELRQSGEWTPRLVEELSLLVRTLRIAIKDEKPFDTRYAAVKSLNGFQHTWQLKPSHHHLMPPLLDLYLVVYDALNDDDDEIRETAAKSATRILASEAKGLSSHDVVPLVASQKLVAFMTTSHRSSPKLCAQAVSRLTAGNVTANSHIQHVDTVLIQAKKEDTALFAEEKRNLYVDEVREALLWSQVLKQLSVKALPKPLVAKFAQWVSQGIATLTEAAQAEVDG
ncbi:hypothetical protein LTR39_001502, partial [Cryomyces antarcticus]